MHLKEPAASVWPQAFSGETSPASPQLAVSPQTIPPQINAAQKAAQTGCTRAMPQNPSRRPFAARTAMALLSLILPAAGASFSSFSVVVAAPAAKSGTTAAAKASAAHGNGQGVAPARPAAVPENADKAEKKEPVAAKEQFGAIKAPAALAARAIGSYARGCLAGAVPLPVDGPAWQAMRLSRNRNWGHPKLIALIERLAKEARARDGWNGLLAGDISQPRGGPMLTGHASHQVGLDADIWLTPMPNRRLTMREREEMPAKSMLASPTAVNTKVWTPSHVRLIKRAASYREVERIFVHPAIKKALCDAAGKDREWLHKVRPTWGHYFHFHIRIACPANSPACTPQPPSPEGDGCGKEIDQWFKRLTAPPPPPSPKPEKPVKPKPPLTLAQLPAECRLVLASPAPGTGTRLAGGEAAPAASKPAPQPKPARRRNKIAGGS